MRSHLTSALFTLASCAMLWLGTLGTPAQARESDPAGRHDAGPLDHAQWNASKRFVTLETGQQLAYVEAGNPAGPPVLMLHGYTDSSRVWVGYQEALSHYRIILPDQRGHGLSATPRCCYAITDFSGDAIQLLDALGIERAAIVGHSLGSFVAQDLAAKHPDRIAALVLLGSTALAPVTNGHPLYETVLGFEGSVAGEGEFLQEWVPRDLPPRYLRAAMDEAGAVPLHVWKDVLRELVDYPVARHARFVSAPVLLLSAGQDELFDRDHHAALQAAYPEADARVLWEETHNFPLVHPETTAALLRDWLERLPPRALVPAS